jgi:hypothetical protein
MNLTIQANGGLKIGYSHLVKRAAIAPEFFDDHKVMFAITTPKTTKKVCPEGVEVTTFCSRSDLIY